MGYGVDIILRDVKFKKEKEAQFWEIAKKLDEEKLDWGSNGFSKAESLEESFEEWRYELTDDGDYYQITEFWGEKLGSDEKLFNALAPILEDCEIVFHGEDNCDWKITVKDGKSEKIHREKF